MLISFLRIWKYLRGLPAIAACFGALMAADSPQKAPFRVLYSNDATNILTCKSPWNTPGTPFTADKLRATVDEVAGMGVDVHILQPGKCAIPWWQSRVYPLKEHFAWIEKTYGLKPDSYARFLLDGGDFVQVFIDRCREKGQVPFIGFRLNDAHLKEYWDKKPGDKIDPETMHCMTPLYRDHPQWRVGPNMHGDWTQRTLDWSIPEVRQHNYRLIAELCENYDFDGLELDYMRFYSYFNQQKTSSEQRKEIMTDFVRSIRKKLDETSKNGKHRWLSVRIPAFIEAWDPMGIDVVAMTQAGVDMLNLSTNYFTAQQTDISKIRKMVPDRVAIYDEMTHCTWNGPKFARGYDTLKNRRTTPEQFYTTAQQDYLRGADGVSLFNFAYYRQYGHPMQGPFSEPPFEVLRHLGDREWLSEQPQHFFLTPNWNAPYFSQPLPAVFREGERRVFHFEMYPPKGGWTKEGRLRIQSMQSLGNSAWQVAVNGVLLREDPDRNEPVPNPYTQLLGDFDEMRAWRVPANVLKEGINEIAITLKSSDQSYEIYYIDCWMP